MQFAVASAVGAADGSPSPELSARRSRRLHRGIRPGHPDGWRRRSCHAWTSRRSRREWPWKSRTRAAWFQGRSCVGVGWLCSSCRSCSRETHPVW